MLILNYSHPLTAEQIAQLKALVGTEPTIRTIAVKIDNAQPLAAQIAALADASGLSPDEWQSTPLIINPPGLAAAAVALLAEMHGRIGMFPTIMRLRPIAGSTPTVYEVAELVNLQTIREQARLRALEREADRLMHACQRAEDACNWSLYERLEAELIEVEGLLMEMEEDNGNIQGTIR